MKNIFAFLMFFISVVPASFAQTIGEYVDLENQIVRKRLLEELNKPAQGATTPPPAILPGQGNLTAPATSIGMPEAKGEKDGGPKTTAIYGLNDNGHGQYKSVVEWNGSRFDAQPGSFIKGYRVESIDKSGTLMVRSGKGPVSRLSAITRTGGAQVLGLMDALKLMGENSYPWLSWHIERIQQNLIRNPNSKGEIFNTGFLSKASLYRVQDIAEYSQLSPMLAQAGDLIMSTAPAEIQKRAVSLRYTMMIITLLTMIGIYAGTYAMVYEFKSTIELQTAFF